MKNQFVNVFIALSLMVGFLGCLFIASKIIDGDKETKIGLEHIMGDK